MSDTLAEQLQGVMARRVGHTHAAVKGVANTKGAVVITATEQEARRLENDYGVEAVALPSVERRFRGRPTPFVVDSYVINQLAAEARNIRSQLAESKGETYDTGQRLLLALTRAETAERRLEQADADRDDAVQAAVTLMAEVGLTDEELRARAEAAERRLAGAAGLLERCQWQHVTLEKVGAAPPEQLVADIRDFLATPSTEGDE